MTERETVVAWLRAMADGFVGLEDRKGADSAEFGRMGRFIYDGCADAIERGDHLKTAERGEEMTK